MLHLVLKKWLPLQFFSVTGNSALCSSRCRLQTPIGFVHGCRGTLQQQHITMGD